MLVLTNLLIGKGGVRISLHWRWGGQNTKRLNGLSFLLTRIYLFICNTKLRYWSSFHSREICGRMYNGVCLGLDNIERNFDSYIGICLAKFKVKYNADFYEVPSLEVLENFWSYVDLSDVEFTLVQNSLQEIYI